MDYILSVCTGIGGLDLGLHAGLRAVGRSPRTVCMVEREAFCIANLVAQMQAGGLDQSPIWGGDLAELPTSDLPRIDWYTGGFPCQPFSTAGKRAGEHDPRHLWPTIREQVRELRPMGVFFENVAGHMSLGLRDVLEDLEGLGFGCSFGLYSAAEVGAPHRRERVFILGLADAGGAGLERRAGDESGPTGPTQWEAGHVAASRLQCRWNEWPSRPGEDQHDWEPARTIEPGLGGDADGLPTRVDRLRALGNAVVPQQAEHAFLRLWELLT